VKVLHVAQSSEYGLGRYLADLAADQVRRGWSVVLAGDPAGSLPTLASTAGADFIPWPATRDPGPSVPAETRRLAGIVRQVDPRVLHLHSSKAGLAGRLAVRGSRPTIFQPHAWSFFAVEGWKRQAALWWEHLGARWATAVVCGSEGERAAGAAAGVRAHWYVVPNAVDLDAFPLAGPDDQAAARAELGLPAPPTPIVVCAGRLAIGQKGQDVLLAAWPHVLAAVPDAQLVLVGDGPDEALLRASAAGLPSVRFAGRRDDVARWLAAADVVVQPSRYETLSLSVLEALATGRPVVATDSVGMREAIEGSPENEAGPENETGPGGSGSTPAAGAIVPPEDPAALADAMARRLRDPELRLREGRAGRERTVRSHDLRRWGEQLAAITETVARSAEPSLG
jgi:glycosyltransferase involved in cell wall biosynthesis